MTISPVRGTGDDERGKRFFVSFSHQWDSLNPFKRLNWRDFTLIQIGGELAGYTGRWEIYLALVGFQVTLTYVYDNAFNEDMAERVKDILKAETGASGVLDPNNELDKLKGQG